MWITTKLHRSLLLLNGTSFHAICTVGINIESVISVGVKSSFLETN